VILIKEVIGNEVSEKIHLLNSYLPFSANAIDSLEKYVNRTKFLLDKEQKLIIVIFESNYNKHIWNSPIVWFLVVWNVLIIYLSFFLGNILKDS